MIHTGGTIAMQTNESGDLRTTQQNPLVQAVSQLKDVTVDQLELFNVPSPHMDHEKMLALSNQINARGNQYDGIVVTHGTDTLEETAYFLDLTITVTCAVVVTGAMRSSDQLGSDGLANIAAAVRVAASVAAAQQGVLVVLNDQIFAARDVTKTHTTNVATFQAPTAGPLGSVDSQQVHWYHQVKRTSSLTIQRLSDPVYLIKTYAGMNDQLVRALDSEQTRGVVFEGMGAGNLPPQILPAVTQLIQRNIPVVVVSRCPSGEVAPIYAYAGGGVELQQAGIMLCRGLNGQKALIRLTVALSAGLTESDLSRFMREAH